MPIIPRPRKRRTRQHVIADQSINYVERFTIDEGHTVQRLTPDYGYDLALMTFDEGGYAEPGVAFIQVKASESWTCLGKYYPFDLDIRDYNLWRIEPFPVILILFDAGERRAFWIHIQDYFADNARPRPKPKAKTVRVLVPRQQAVHRRAVARWRLAKKETIARLR